MQRTAGKQSPVSLTRLPAVLVPADDLGLVHSVFTAAFVFQALAVNPLF